MIRYWIVALCLSSVVLPLAPQGGRAADSEPPRDTGQLVGILTDKDGRLILVGKAAVFLCDAVTGMPIHRETKQPLQTTLRDPQLDKLWVVETDNRSHFEFHDVPVGRYRVVAQSWSGTEGFPGFVGNREPSAFVILHGVAENVQIVSGERCAVEVKPLGDHVLRIVNDPQEAHALLLISLKPTLGDGILGPYGWGKEFRRHLVGVTQMEVPHVTIIGLPEDATVHVGLMNYDNNPGVGAASYAAGAREGQLRIVASWSNGHQEPPAELLGLTDHLAKKRIAIASFLPGPEKKPLSPTEAWRELLSLLTTDNERIVEVPGLGEKRLADVIAAYGYLRLRKPRQ